MATAIIGDLHAPDTKPKSRMDDYPTTCIDKLESILKLYKYVIILGDLFHSSSVSTEYCNKLIKRLKPYKGRLHSILGNHDASYRTLNLDKTDMGTLINSDVIDLHLESFELEGISYDVASVVPELKLPEKKSDILLGHFYLDNNLAPKESLSMKDLKNYQYVFLGHDHSPYSTIVTETTNVYRMGSFMRNTADGYNLVRDTITYAIIDKGVVSLNQLKVVPAKEVFIPEAYNNMDRAINKICDLSNLDNLISNFKKRNPSESISTLKILQELETPEASMEYLKLIHEQLGLRF